MTTKEYRVLMSGLPAGVRAPKGRDVFYRCTKCGGIIPSSPETYINCPCENIGIDIDAFRLWVNDPEKFEVIQRR